MDRHHAGEAVAPRPRRHKRHSRRDRLKGRIDRLDRPPPPPPPRRTGRASGPSHKAGCSARPPRGWSLAPIAAGRSSAPQVRPDQPPRPAIGAQPEHRRRRLGGDGEDLRGGVAALGQPPRQLRRPKRRPRLWAGRCRRGATGRIAIRSFSFSGAVERVDPHPQLRLAVGVEESRDRLAAPRPWPPAPPHPRDRGSAHPRPHSSAFSIRSGRSPGTKSRERNFISSPHIMREAQSIVPPSKNDP